MNIVAYGWLISLSFRNAQSDSDYPAILLRGGPQLPTDQVRLAEIRELDVQNPLRWRRVMLGASHS